MLIVFVGESAGRNIVVPGGMIVADRNVPVEVPDDLGKSLLEQSVWEAAKPAKKEAGS